VNTIDHYSFKGHGLSAEDMNIGCLILSFQVVEDTQDQSNCLDGSVEILFAKKVEEGHYDDGSKILDVEDVFPSDLLSQIFEAESAIGESDKFKVFFIICENNFGLSIFIGKFLLEDGYSGLSLKLLFDPPDSFFIIGGDKDLPVFVFDVEV